MKNLVLLVYTFLLTAVFIYTTPDLAKADSCSTNGFCDTVCGPPGNYGCTYANCGNGTELCTTAEDIQRIA